MKKILLILPFLCAPSWGAAAFVQRSTGTYSASTTCTVTLRALTAGNFIACELAANITGNPSSVKSTNNTLVLVASAVVTGAQTSLIYALPNIVGGDTSVVFTNSSASGDCSCHEASGIKTSAATDRFNKVDNGVQANPENGATVTPSDAGVFCVAAITPHTAVTTVTSWTGSFPANGNGFAYRLPGSTSALTPSWGGDSGGVNYCATTACFLPAPAATTTACVSPFCGVIGKEQ